MSRAESELESRHRQGDEREPVQPLSDWEAEQAWPHPGIPEAGLVLGVDVGFSRFRRSSGVAVLAWNRTDVWIRVDHVTQKEVIPTVEEFIADREVDCAALDGPFGRDLRRIENHRNVERILTRALGHRIGKPGHLRAPVGQLLHAATNEVARALCEKIRLRPAHNRARIHDLALAEAFPAHFLGVLLVAPEEIPPVRRKNRSDRFYCRLLGPDDPAPMIGGENLPTNRLQALLEQMLSGRTPDRRFETIRNHDERAAIVCALTALCIVTGEYLAVGDAEDGFIILPSPARTGRIGAQDWACTKIYETAQEVAMEKGELLETLVIGEPASPRWPLGSASEIRLRKPSLPQQR